MSARSGADPVVFGAGMMRTGTMSLQKALEILLKGPCYHGTVFLQRSDHLQLWEKALDNGNLSKGEWRFLYNGYRAAVDVPTCLFYDGLAKAFPDAKIILTVRDPDEWERSINATVMKLKRRTSQFPMNVIIFFTPFRAMPRVMEKIVRFASVSCDLPPTRALDAEYFRRHVERVQSVVPSERLLVFKASDGWGPLCEFLDLPVPDVPYPYENASGAFMSSVESPFRGTVLKTAVRWTVVGGLTAVVAYHIYKRWVDIQTLVVETFDRFWPS